MSEPCYLVKKADIGPRSRDKLPEPVFLRIDIRVSHLNSWLKVIYYIWFVEEG